MISIIIPVLNEENNIKNLLLEILKYTKKLKPLIYIIDGNSTDKTVEIIHSLNRKNIKVIISTPKKINVPHNCRDIRLGLNEAIKSKKSKFFFVFDGDGSYDPKQIITILKYIRINKEYGFGQASKNLKQSINNRPLIRKLVSLFYHYLCVLILNKRISSDYSAAFRCFDINTLRILLKKKIIFVGAIQHLEDFLFLKSKKIKHFEIPMNYRHRKFGKSNVDYSLYISYLKDLISCAIKYRGKI